jgi:hypothetical protein
MIVFNYFLFNQIDVVYHNEPEFAITIDDVIGGFIWRAVLLWLAFVFVLTVVNCFSKKGFKYTIATIIGLVLAGYAQVLFMNNEDMMKANGTMAGTTPIWVFILNFIAYAAIVALPIVALYLERKYKKNFTKVSAIAVIAVVLGMQVVGTVATSAQREKPIKDNELYYFSVDEQLKLSRNENIIVFVLDRLDTDVTDKIFADNPDTRNVFGGFTYYTNNISEFQGTFPSVASFLTNKEFDKHTKKPKDYLKSAWSGNNLFDTMHGEGYKVNALADTIATFYDFKDVQGKIDNIRKVDRKNRHVNGNQMFWAMLSYTGIRNAADCLKYAFTNDNYLDIANYCVDIKNTPDYFPRTVSGNSDLRFMDKLKTTGLAASESQNVLSFVHLQSSHNPYMYNENLKKIKFASNGGFKNQVNQTKGTFKILNEYLTQLETLGKFQDSTIIFMADHGTWNNKMGKFTEPPIASLLVKPRGVSRNTALVTDTQSQLSNRNFQASVLQAANAYTAKSNLGIPSYGDIITAGGVQERVFHYVQWANVVKCHYNYSLVVKGDANDIKNWVRID